MNDEYIRLDTTIIAIDNLINEAATGTMVRTLFKAKDTIYNQQRYVIDVQPVKHGRWECVGHDDTTYWYRCSVCGHEEHDNMTKHDNYCGSCGARMDGDSE